MELLEACRYGLVEQVHYFIKTGVNVNVADFVSCVSTYEGRIMQGFGIEMSELE